MIHNMEEELIKQVQANPILYDLKNKGYRNQTLRKEAWDEIGEHLGRSGEYCKETWNKLRNAYTNALNRRKSKGNRESCRKMPKWTFEDQMSFLPISAAYRPRQNERHSIENSQDETQYHHNDSTMDYDGEAAFATKDEEDEEYDIKPSLLHASDGDAHSTADDQSDITAQHHFENSKLQGFLTPSRKESNSQNKKLEATMNNLVTEMKNHNKMLLQHFSQNTNNNNNNNNCTSHDDDEMYFLSLAKFVKKLNPAERIRVKGEVSQIVFQAELRNLSNNDAQNNHQQQSQKQQIPSTSQHATSTQQVLTETGFLIPKIEID